MTQPTDPVRVKPAEPNRDPDRPIDPGRHRTAAAIVERFTAGESAKSLAVDYDMTECVVEIVVAAYREGWEDAE